MTWILSAMTILMMWLMGNKTMWGPRVALLTQALWVVYILQTKQYGLLPSCGALAVVAVRNMILWGRQGKGMSK